MTIMNIAPEYVTILSWAGLGALIALAMTVFLVLDARYIRALEYESRLKMRVFNLTGRFMPTKYYPSTDRF